MSEIKETVLYNREKDGIEVTAKQVVKEEVIKEATEEAEAVSKKVREYITVATVNGEVVADEQGKSYRQTIQDARKLFKKVYTDNKPAEEVVVEASEEAVAEEVVAAE